MAGSRKWFKYTTDSGTTFALEGDESNIEAVNGTTNDYVSGDVGTVNFAVPRNVGLRTASYGNATRVITVAVLTKTLFDALPTGVTSITDPLDTSATPGTLSFIRKRPETIRFPRPDDTGINDGDAT
jgi:hypothetical protein